MGQYRYGSSDFVTDLAGLARVVRLQPVVRDIRPVERPGKHPGGVHAVHLDPLSAGKDDHADRVRTPAADHHLVAAIGAARPMRAQDVVRIVVLARDKAIQIQIGTENGFAR